MKRFAYTLLLLLFAITPAWQVQAKQDNHSFLQLVKNEQQSLNKAVNKIKKQTGGRILSAKTVNQKGQPVHHIKVLLPSGKVRIFKVKP